MFMEKFSFLTSNKGIHQCHSGANFLRDEELYNTVVQKCIFKSFLSHLLF